MSYEWHVNFLLERGSTRDLQDVVEGQGRFEVVLDLYARLKLLAQSVEDSGWNRKAKSMRRRDKARKVEIPLTYERIMLTYYEQPEKTRYTTEHITKLSKDYASMGFDTPRLDEEHLAKLPENSFFLYIPFTLAAPHVSKDDEPFYVHENPLHKDWVLRIPTVSSTSWKGSFRAALRWRLQAEDNDSRVIRLLGNPKGEEKNFRRGRLSFFPTFFDQVEVGVINPHSRQRGAGTQPIDIEQVPRGAHGVFALLYTPTIPSGPEDPLPDWDEVLEDIDLVGKAVYTLLMELGFGAKTSSGMGRAEEDITGAYLLVHRRIELKTMRDLQQLRELLTAKIGADTKGGRDG